MLYTIIGIFIILHGIIHGFYIGHSLKFFELSPGMRWPIDSWILSRISNDKTIRFIASILLLVALAGFVLGGFALLLDLGWHQYIIFGSSFFSTFVYILFWNKTTKKLHDQGGIGILINVLIFSVTYFVYQ
ncbi:hypothetical protein GF406_04820 [candidate division KSB1 bacterium]|nr:hypothetical protein [candidate division KSB1 bacterium]